MQRSAALIRDGLGLGVDLSDEVHFAHYVAPSRLRLQTGPGGTVAYKHQVHIMPAVLELSERWRQKMEFFGLRHPADRDQQARIVLHSQPALGLSHVFRTHIARGS